MTPLSRRSTDSHDARYAAGNRIAIKAALVTLGINLMVFAVAKAIGLEGWNIIALTGIVDAFAIRCGIREIDFLYED